ncbi:MAG TPA: glycerol-3-phosphate 1-O-acyltransferase PlsY [Alphaproteobacteria bacterium]|nr:glycerol-3-phosphate 1-O-acyltransferase PlsY [Alphaproteobacteria bacterium]
MAYAVILLSYLLGSIPFGYVLTKLAGLGDIRSIGSGNIGATNVLRTGNKKLAAAVLLLDGIKGAVAVIIAQHLAPDVEAFAGFAVLLGHLFPVWLKFKGGKGVATAIGILTALMWQVGALVMIIWLATAFLFNYSSLAALVSIGVSPLILFLVGRRDLVWLGLIIVILVFWKHEANIRRLFEGTESKIGKSKNESPPAE